MTASSSLLSSANKAFRQGDYAEALKLYDQVSLLSPRNHWARLNAVSACLKLGDLNSAKLRLANIKCSKQLGERIPSAVAGVLEERIRAASGSNVLINYPTDYYQWTPGCGNINGIKQISINRKLPSGFPFELVLPNLNGEQNDFRFLMDVTNRYRAEGNKYSKKGTIAVFFEDSADLDEVRERMNAQSYPKELFEVAVFMNKGAGSRQMPQFRGHRFMKYDPAMPLGTVNDFFNQTRSDFFVMVPGSFRPDETFVERISHYFHVTNKAVVGIVRQEHDNPIDEVLGLFDCTEIPAWTKELFPFRDIGAQGLCMSRQLFQTIGGFSPDIVSNSVSVTELSYRAFIHGAYFLPESCGFDGTDESVFGDVPSVSPAGEKIEDYCAAHWYRKGAGVYRIPTVSVYIPSYNNGPYIVQAIESVLSQNYQDFEICISDDGSTDGTVELLEKHYSDNPKVRWVSNANGGIGFASNRAVEMARGMYIGQLDSDDVLKPGALERLVKFLDEHPKVGCAYTSCERIDQDGKFLKNEYNFPEFSREKMMVTSITHHFRMFRRQAWSRTSGFREDILNAVDYDMFLKLSEVCGFHHIDEIFYQRRWHGNNTSFVDEVAQSENTKTVLHLALERLGLANKWEAVAKDPKQPRKISYKRKSGCTRIFFWPNYSKGNPYQKLLYGRLDDSFDVYAGDIDCAIKVIQDDPNAGDVIFHLHWLNKIFDVNSNESDTREKVVNFEKKIIDFKESGGKLVWTMHNAVSHEARFEEMELQFSKKLIDLCDIVHLHSINSLPEIQDYFDIPREKIRIIPHGNYVKYYPNYVSPALARKYLGLRDDEFVLLFCGQIRQYKGLEELVEAYRQDGLHPKRKLLIAGQANYDFKGYLDEAVPPGLRNDIVLINRFIEDNTLQLLFKAADFSIFPYKRILTSGSVMLSMGFGVPCIVPSVGMTRDVITHGENGLLFSRESENALFNDLREAENLKLSGALPAMQQAAFSSVAELDWRDVDVNLYSQRDNPVLNSLRKA